MKRSLTPKGQPGFPIPLPGKNDLRPNDRDADKDRGVLSHVRGNAMVHDFGAPKGEPWWWIPTAAPSRADFTPGNPPRRAKSKDDEHAPIQTGIKRT